METVGSINQYKCPVCGQSITTVNRDNGVTPMFLACRATAGCKGHSRSVMYECDQSLTPGFEWYRPTRKAMRKMDPDTRYHCQQGGMLIRKIQTT